MKERFRDKLTPEQDSAVIVRRDVSISIEASVVGSPGGPQTEILGYVKRFIAQFLEEDGPSRQTVELVEFPLDLRGFQRGIGHDRRCVWMRMRWRGNNGSLSSSYSYEIFAAIFFKT